MNAFVQSFVFNLDSFQSMRGGTGESRVGSYASVIACISVWQYSVYKGDCV